MSTSIVHREILEHLRQRREFCQTLLDLSRRQRRLIADGELAGLLDVIGRKQKILGRLDAAKKSQPQVLADWNNRRDELDAATRGECESLLKAIEAALAELLAEEQNCTDQLTRRRDETRRQLAEISSRRQVHGAYGQPAENVSPRVLDVNQ